MIDRFLSTASVPLRYSKPTQVAPRSFWRTIRGEINDRRDTVFVWSDDPGEWLADRLIFNFTSGYNSDATAGNTSFRGLRTMLVQSASSGQEAFVGIGDLDAVRAIPEERLDELDGKVRIRELPGTSSNDAVSKYYGGVQHGGHRDERGARRGDMGADLVHRACIGLRVDLSSRRVSPTGTSGSSRTLRHDFSTTTFTPLDFHYIRSIMNAQFHSASLLGLRVAPTGRQADR